MPKIKNKLFQPVAITIAGGKTLSLQSRQEAEVSKADLESRHLQSLIKNGDVALTEEGERPEARPMRR